MNKILLIIEREFMSRVRKKSFIIMTFLTPILFAAMLVLPSLLMRMESTELTTIAVIDNSKQFEGKIKETEYIKLKFLNNETTDNIKKNFESTGYYALLYINRNAITNPDSIILYSNKQPSIDVVSHISNSIEKEIETQKLKAYKIDNIEEIIKTIKTNVDVRTIKITKEGEEKESNTLITAGIGYVMGFMMYMMVLLFGTQVMQGVIEEKTNRVVEVIISSAKPFELMMGKILGIVAVCLVQILAWIILTYTIGNVAITALSGNQQVAQTEQVQKMVSSELQQQNVPADVKKVETTAKSNDILKLFGGQNILLIITSFIFYFIFGFLLYAALFAAVGSAVDNAADTQQLVMPITLPLILALLVMFSGLKSPDGAIAFWFSIIPFTSPIVMLARIPFGVPAWQLALSAGLLVATFVATTWFAAKIYRTGILLYGKKGTWKEMWKWVRYKG